MFIGKLKKYVLSNEFLYIITGIYMITLFLCNVVYYFTTPVFEMTIKCFRFICYIFFVLNIIRNWKNGESLTIGMMIFATLSCVIALFSKNKDIMFLFIFCYSVKKLSLKKIIENTFKIYIFLFLIIVNLSLLKIIPDWIFARGSMKRHSLGFNYSTIAIGTFLSCILMYFYVRKSNATFFELLLLETINVFLFRYTDGRMSFILISMILFIMLLSKVTKIKKLLKSQSIQNVLSCIGAFLPLSLFLLVIIVTFLYDKGSSFGININNLLSGRLFYTRNAFQEYGISLFGQSIDWKGWGGLGYVDTENISNFIYNYVDISYARMVFDYGIIPTILILVMYSFALVKNVKEKKYWMYFTLIFICIWSTIEPYLFNLSKNIFILSFVQLLDFGKIKQLDYNSIKSIFKKDSNNEKFDS